MTETVEQVAKAIAWDEFGPFEDSWESNHSCSMGRYGCCGGGKDIDRAALAKQIAAALASAEARALRWQPIETAPKDGSTVLVWADSGVHLMRWNGTRWALWHHPKATQPTHWMPLPEPPRATEKESQR